MAGCLFGIPLSQWRNADGTPMAGGLLYIFEAGTTTPADAFQDFGLTPGLELTHPIVADANGLIPAFFVNDGAYRARLTDSAGSLVLFDIDGIQAIGPSSGTGGGGGGVDPTAIATTGDVIWKPVAGTRSGWVRCNARTIGSATSGASERANADTQPLYEFLWNNFTNDFCPVTGGRGASAVADFGANKPIATLDFRGMTPVGLADMGNADSGLLDNVSFFGSKTTPASRAGAATHTLTPAETPSHAHGIQDPGHTHVVNASGTSKFGVNPGAATDTNWFGAAGDTPFEGPAQVTSESALTGVTMASVGGDGAHNNMQPTVLGSFYIKL